MTNSIVSVKRGEVKDRNVFLRQLVDALYIRNDVDLARGSFRVKGDTVDVVSDADTETILYAEMPVKTVLRITYTEPGLKGDTATNTLKPATVETGAEVRVPLFIEEGELIEVDTRDGSYQNRVKE